MPGNTDNNIKEVVPFLMVSNMKASVQFYVDQLGFTITHRWEPDGVLQWCSIRLGGASLMMQETKQPLTPNANSGISVYFICEDALLVYKDLRSRGVNVKTPFVGNSMWVTGVVDPDGYEIFFESFTTEPEETVYEKDKVP